MYQHLSPELMAQRKETAQALWAAYQARDWKVARQLFCDDAEAIWWATQETFIGADAIVHVNAIYPEGWTIVPLECNALLDGRVHTLVRVDMEEQVCYANSFFSFAADRITRLEEFWSDVTVAPEWRREAGLLNYRLLAGHKPA